MKEKIAVLGGDRRQLAAAIEWKKCGFEPAIYGFDTCGDICSLPLNEALDGACAVVLPVPASRDGVLNTPYSEKPSPRLCDIATMLPDSVVLVCGGMLPDGFTSSLADQGKEVFDMCKSERFNLLNAIPTVEGAIELAMTHLPITIYGSKTAVLGFGRIGRLLCRDLKMLGASVTAVSRSERDKTLSETDGCIPCDLPSLLNVISDMDIIFNTVPCNILTDDYLSRLPHDTPIIDLASRPGGVDTGSALKRGCKVITALSLPGKVAPVSAGRIIARCVNEKLAEVIS